jgi:alkylation response protein AidB-like acyl-CoA dehydrogenase
MWTLVRTDPTAPKHKGLSLMFIPFGTPGMSVNPIETWGEEAPCEVVLDNVRVPKDHLIGEANKGWTYVNSTLGFERMIIGSSGDLRRVFDELVKLCKLTVIDGEVLAKKPAVRMRIAELAMDLEVAGLFGCRAASNLEAGGLSSAHASMMKVFISELRAKLTDWGMQIMELYGQLNRSDPAAPMLGRLELDYRRAPYLRFGGGTTEVQRGIVAQGIGMPRR